MQSRTLLLFYIIQSVLDIYLYHSYLIVNFLTQLESISIYSFAEVNKSVKML